MRQPHTSIPIALAAGLAVGMPWPFSCNIDGRARMNWNGKMVMVSRYLCEAVNGPPPLPTFHAAHSCGNGHLGCVAKAHISWKSPTENARDKVAHGTEAVGSKNGSSKLTENDAARIIAMKGTRSQRHIAKMFGVDQKVVCLIHKGRIWRHVHA